MILNNFLKETVNIEDTLKYITKMIKYDETSNAVKNSPLCHQKKEKISVNQCLK